MYFNLNDDSTGAPVIAIQCTLGFTQSHMCVYVCTVITDMARFPKELKTVHAQF